MVASQWVVGATATERLMAMFFERHLAGDPPALALRAAQRAMRTPVQANPPTSENPDYIGPHPARSHSQDAVLGIGGRPRPVTVRSPEAVEPFYWAGFAFTGM